MRIKVKPLRIDEYRVVFETARRYGVPYVPDGVLRSAHTVAAFLNREIGDVYLRHSDSEFYFDRMLGRGDAESAMAEFKFGR